MTDLPTGTLTDGHLAHHEALHSVAGGDLDVSQGETGHTAAHAALKTWAAGEGVTVGDYNGYGAAHDDIHRSLHVLANQLTAGTGDPHAVPTGDLPGWTTLVIEDFSRGTEPVGTFPNTYWDTIKAGYGEFQFADDTSNNGVYRPFEVLSVVGGADGSANGFVMDYHLRNSGGENKVAAPFPEIGSWGQLYGRYSVRFRAVSPVSGFKLAYLLWPTSELWPQDGEIDYPEGNIDDVWFAANVYDWTPETGHVSDIFHTGLTYTDWHVATIDWRPSRLEFFADGQSLGVVTENVPDTDMRWVLQAETSTDGNVPATNAECRVQVDWFAAWSYTP